MIAFTVAAKLMLKLGARVPEAHRAARLETGGGLSLFRCGRIVCVFQLRRVPLNIAQVLPAAQLVVVNHCREPWGWASRFRWSAGWALLVIGPGSL